MFTGIVEAIGKVTTRSGRPARLTVGAPADWTVPVGASVAVNGVCLTLTAGTAGTLTFDLMRETLARTALGELRPGDEVNLERALPATGRFDGHLVTGHTDGIATIVAWNPRDEYRELVLELPEGYESFVAPQGSLAVDGISLTVIGIEGRRARFGIIPHTLDRTALRGKRAGARVNVEVDLIARYVHRRLAAGGDGLAGKLKDYGYTS